MSQLKSCALVAAASALICGNATAQNDQWSGNSSRNINDPLKWSLGVPNNTKWMEFSPAWSTGPFGGLLDMNGGGSTLGMKVDASGGDRKSTRLNSSHLVISYAGFCL